MRRADMVTALQVLVAEAGASYTSLLDMIADVDEPLSWAVFPLHDGQYLHNNASILGIVQHIAGCKFMYGSAAFRNTEVRWRDVAMRLQGIGSSWSETKEYLHESQDYWMSSWSDSSDLSDVVNTNWGDKWPAWKVIYCMTTHDMYHAGQIQIMKSSLSPSDVPPESMAEMTEQVLCDSPSW